MPDPLNWATDDVESVGSNWEPEWRVPLGEGEVGLALDDGCFVALVQDEWGYWSPTAHVPREVGLLMGDLAMFVSS